jgi:bacteriocin-like protein
MKSLNIDELNQVQGGGIVTTWAIRAVGALADLVTLVEVGIKVEFDPSSYGAVDAGGYNPMGDYTNGICLR